MADTRNITVTKDTQSTVKIEGEIPFGELLKHKNAAVKKLGKEVKIDGFREGHVPEDVLVRHVGEMTLLTDMAEKALSSIYPEIVKEHKLDVIGHPQVSITKLAQDNPLGFTATVAIMPEIMLPDYKALAEKQKKESADVTGTDLDEAIRNIQRQKLAYERLQKKADQGKKAEDKIREKNEDGVTDLPTPETVAKEDESVTTQEPAHTVSSEATGRELDKLPLPKLTDEYVKTLGDFTSVQDFKKKLGGHLAKEKEQETIQKHRAAITDAIVEKSTIDLPEIMVDSEVNQMFAQMEADLTRANLKLDDYLTHIKKTKEELFSEWRPAAEKRAKLQLVLNEISKKENVEVDKEKVDAEVTHLMSHHKDADQERVRIYVETMLKNEEVMKLLEGTNS